MQRPIGLEPGREGEPTGDLVAFVIVVLSRDGVPKEAD